jgi:hypothetical protein
VISTYYNIPIIGEELDKLYEKLFGLQWIRTGVSEQEPSYYSKLLKSHLANIESSVDGVMRIHPTQLSLIPKNGKVFDFDWYKFSQYNKVYFTSRSNIPELVSSLFVAHRLNKFTYKDTSQVLSHIEPMVFDEEGHDRILMLLYSDLVSKHLKQYLTSIGVEWEHIDYDDIPEYIEQKFDNLGSENVETHYNYKDIVTNYNEILGVYERLKIVAHKRFYEANPNLDK